MVSPDRNRLSRDGRRELRRRRLGRRDRARGIPRALNAAAGADLIAVAADLIAAADDGNAVVDDACAKQAVAEFADD